VLSPIPGESATLMGEATFDAVDRLAIMNPSGAYAHYYDAGRLDQWQTVFTDAADVRFFARDRAVSVVSAYAGCASRVHMVIAVLPR